MKYSCKCGHDFEEELGKYGCPYCCGANGAATLTDDNIEKGKLMKHFTVGEWKTEADGSLVIAGQVIAQAHQLAPDGAVFEEQLANSTLMSAAPNLLVCLDKLLNIIDDRDMFGGAEPPVLDECWQAIKKAKGHK